jgi:ABC-type sugar transport system ATPase subunit
VSANEQPLLEVRGVSKSFAANQALRDVTFSLAAGEIVGLVGENGAGKSTLIRLLSGVMQPDEGEIWLDGAPAHLRSPIDAQRAGIATVYQEFNFFDSLSVAENLLLGSYPRRYGLIDWGALRDEARVFLANHRLNLDVGRRVATLSVAEKQILEIAKALHQRVRILILDEPTAALGGDDVEDLLNTMRSLRADGIAVIFVSHRLEEVLGIADTYVVLKDGAKIDDGRIEQTNHQDLVAKMVGRVIAPNSANRGDAVADDEATELLRVEGLTRLERHGGMRPISNISFSVRAGEIVGLAGLRGAGRTEVARAIFGADPIDGGAIFVNGKSVQIDSPRAAVKSGIGLVPEERAAHGLLLNLSSAQNIPLVRMARAGGGWIRPKRERKLARDYASRLKVRVADVAQSVRGLSGGNQQKIVIAKWLEAGVSILILDEPTRGIDILAKEEIYRTIRDLCKEGMGVLLISSELPEVLAMSDRILVMHEGSIAAEFSTSAATEERVMHAAVGATT